MTFFDQLFTLPRELKKFVMVSVDCVILPFAIYSAFLLKTSSVWPFNEQNLWLLIAAPVISIPIFTRLGLYRAVIRYFGSKMVFTILKGTLLSVLLLGVLVKLIGTQNVALTTLAIYWAIAVIYVGGSRYLVRDWYQQKQRPQNRRENVVIYGAGAAGAQLAMGLSNGRDYRPVAFIDDRLDLVGRVIQGVSVYSPNDLSNLIKDKNVTQLLLATPSASRARRRQILAQMEKLPVLVKTIPQLADLVAGNARVDEIREVEIEDLLGRDPVPPNDTLLSKCICGKSVMVTGAGGSIGSELCRQIIRLKPSRLVLFELSEYGLYEIAKELDFLNRKFYSLKDRVEVVSVLGSVTHRRRVEAVIRSFNVQTIYHAAAYKHVPLVEHNPIEGVQNNLCGTWRTAEAARASNVETFVLVSTDKAVRPTNVMGATKRMAELVLQAMQELDGNTRFCMVRFGNVLGSSGSVVPLFREQIKKGGPITVTHQEISRYFMTIPEAAQLVLQAGSMGEGGDVFVLDMGEPVKIIDLARRMINLSGLDVKDTDNPDGDIEIQVTGLRPGEKLYEELLIGDNVSGTEHPLIMRAMESEIEWKKLSVILNEIEKACVRFDSSKVRDLLMATVSGYVPQCDIMDPVWKMILENQDLKKLASLVDNVQELDTNRVVN